MKLLYFVKATVKFIQLKEHAHNNDKNSSNSIAEQNDYTERRILMKKQRSLK